MSSILFLRHDLRFFNYVVYFKGITWVIWALSVLFLQSYQNQKSVEMQELHWGELTMVHLIILSDRQDAYISGITISFVLILLVHPIRKI